MSLPEPGTMLAFVLATTAVVVVPGPSVTFVVTRSAQHGIAAGLMSVLGLETAAAVHAALSAAGVTAVLRVVPMGTQVVAWAGAGYLVWLAVRTLRQRRAVTGTAGALPARRHRLFLDALIVDLLNPKTALFFLAFLPRFVELGHGSAGMQLAFLGAVFVVIAALCDSAYAVLAGSFSERLRMSPRAHRLLGAISAGVYLALAAAAVAL